MTDRERRAEIESICDAALDRPASERDAYIAVRCEGNETLRREVEALLAHAAKADDFLGERIEAIAAHALSVPAGSLVGRDLGAYHIDAFIGAGGMGEVYRARDSRLGRDVAIKVLPASFDADRDRVARFEREARVLAALNHPHIAAIYGVHDVDGATVLVLELVAGETLAARIARGPIPLREALPMARQIADALEAAHDKGVIHRDLKPSNIGLTTAGSVKVLDFGLARAVGETVTADASQSPTLTITGSHDGRLLGTAAYMSPEQARGQSVDKRTDVWAFGCVFYEMLTGRTAFSGPSASDYIAAILARDPDWTALPEQAPTHIRRLLRRCLEKDPKHRLRDIADARLELDEPDDQPNPTVRRGPVTPLTVALFVLAAALAAAGLWSLSARRAASNLGTLRFEIATPPTRDPGSLALSPDGRQLAFVSTIDNTQRLWVRTLDQLTPRPLAGTDGARYPFWAPDGAALGFFAQGKLKRIDLAGGAAQVLADAPRAAGGTWNGAGVIVFAPSAASPLMRVPAVGGTPVPVTRLPEGVAPRLGGSHRFPEFLPDGRRFLFFVSGRPDRRGVYLGSIDGGTASRVLADAETPAAYAPPGVLLLVRQGALVAYPFDLARGVVSGDPLPVALGVGTDEEFTRGAFAVSATGGVLAHRGAGHRRQLVWVDRTGTVLGELGPVDESLLANPELSPDGRRVAMERTVQGNTDVWLIDVGRGVLSRFTFDASVDHAPVFSADGRSVAFASTRNGVHDLFEKPTTAAADEQPLLVNAGGKVPMAWSSDGRFLLYAAINLKTGVDDLWALPLSERKPFPVLQTPFEQGAAQFSPDGRWIAYESNESGPVTVYVRPFPGPGGQWQVSATGGSQPRWRADGKELFYIGPDGRVMAVPIATRAGPQAFEMGTPTPLFQTQLASGNDLSINGTDIHLKPQYAVGRDGKFLVNVSVEGNSGPPITLVLNWQDEVKPRLSNR